MDFIKQLKEKHNIQLSEQQQKAVLNIDGPILLLAVPGGGKTTVIVSRCANMVIKHKIDPENILTLTFSKASALDMKHRFSSIFGIELGNKLHFSTIHSFCYNVLRTYTNKMQIAFPAIIEDEKALITKNQLLRQLYHKYNGTYISDDMLDELSNTICYIKNMMVPENEIDRYKTSIENFGSIFKSYEAYKRQYNYIDFDDMLTKTLELFNQNADLINAYRNKYLYINVDESQDTSFLQHQIIKCLANPRNNIFMVGDEDQSIYSFRAAFPKALLDFKKTYTDAQVLLMENNYRSTKCIVVAANRFIRQNKERYEKNMFSDRDDGIPVKFTCLQEKNNQYEYLVSSLEAFQDYSEAAVLYRNNVSAIPLADTLNYNNIPFYLREAKTYFFKHWITTDIISFMDLSIDISNTEAFRQVYYKINAYLSKPMAEYAMGNVKQKQNLIDVLLEYTEITGRQKNKLQEVKKNVLKIAKLKPAEAIEFIVDVIGYGDYLKKQSSDGTETTDALMQIISVLKSIASKTDSIRQFKDRLEQLRKMMDNAKYNKNAVTLSTIHSSKGLEFDNVFIIDLFDGQFPTGSSISELKTGNKSLMEEEVRLFYVGATRARQHLELISADKLDGKKVKPSRFIEQFLAVYKKQAPNADRKEDRKADSGNWEADYGEYKDNGPISENILCLEMPVVHKKFGIGNIRAVNPKVDLLEIYFIKSGLRTLSLKTCLDGDIIHGLKLK